MYNRGCVSVVSISTFDFAHLQYCTPGYRISVRTTTAQSAYKAPASGMRTFPKTMQLFALNGRRSLEVEIKEVVRREDSDGLNNCSW